MKTRYTPWTLKKRPAGDWVIDQYDSVRGVIRRFGVYSTEADARETYAVLIASAPSC